MDAKEAKEALELHGGFRISGNIRRVKEFVKGLEFAKQVLDMQIKMSEFCDQENACDNCPYRRGKDEEYSRCMNDFIVY